MRSDRWVHDRLLCDATAPTEYRWAGLEEDPDIAIFLAPLHQDLKAPERLHKLRLEDLSRLFVFSQADTAVPWAPGMFTSVAARRAGTNFAGGCYLLPGYQGVGEQIDQMKQPPDLLWSFFGTVRHHPQVRGQILAVRDVRGLARDADVWNTVRWAEAGAPAARRAEVVAAYAQSVARAKFVVAPRGNGPSSLRLFEAMRAGRAPVIVSDDWLPPALVDWSTCAVRVPEADISFLPRILREREDEAEELGRRAREVWEQHFSPRSMVHHIVRTCLQLHERNPSRRRRLRLAVTAGIQREALRRGREVVRAERAALRSRSRPLSSP